MAYSENDFQRLQRRLIREEKLSLAYTAILAAQAMNRFSPEAREAALRWARGESIADFVLAEVSVAELQEQLGGGEFQALCMLDLLSVNYEAFADATLVSPIDDMTFGDETPVLH